MNTPVTREALERAMRNDELVLFYQPKVCLLSGDVIGAEALVRWADGNNTVLSPDEFLPLVESSGLLHDLTLQLLDQLVKAIVTLRASAPLISRTLPHRLPLVPFDTSRAFSLSINVAPDDLASRTISNHIHSLLQAGTICAPELQIEITESAVMGNVDRVYDDLVRLKDMGIKILMDDFGTGYSSIDRLSQLPFDSLKLDQGVVKRMGTSRQNLDVVRSAISMARELGMTSVAEGIESEAVYNFLIAHGCVRGRARLLSRTTHVTAGFSGVCGYRTRLRRVSDWTSASGSSELAALSQNVGGCGVLQSSRRRRRPAIRCRSGIAYRSCSYAAWRMVLRYWSATGPLRGVP